MREVEARTLKEGFKLIIITYGKIYPDSYFEKKKGRRPSVTSYKVDTNKVETANLTTITFVTTHRKTIDMDSRDMITRIQYSSDSNNSTLAIAPDALFTEIEENIYIQSSHLPLIDQIKAKLND